MSGRRPGLAIAAVVLALVAIVVLSKPRQDPYLRPRLDPRATGPEGLAALVGVLRDTGATVDVGGRPTPADAVALQPEDNLTGSAATDLEAWVRAGGTLVVTDPESPLAAPIAFGPHHSSPSRGTCALTALHSVRRLGVALSRSLAVTVSDTDCFADREGAGLVARSLGAGVVVTLSSIGPLLNENLGRGDDAALAVSLLAPSSATRVRVLNANEFFAGTTIVHRGVLAALGARTQQSLWELALAFLAWAFYRGRRLGKVVPEELPVPVPSSDLVLAVGEMLGRGEDLGAVAERLRRQARRELGIAVGLGPAPDVAELSAALHRYVTLDADDLQRALVAPVPDLPSLVAMSHQLDRLAKETSR